MLQISVVVPVIVQQRVPAAVTITFNESIHRFVVALRRRHNHRRIVLIPNWMVSGTEHGLFMPTATPWHTGDNDNTESLDPQSRNIPEFSLLLRNNFTNFHHSSRSSNDRVVPPEGQTPGHQLCLTSLGENNSKALLICLRVIWIRIRSREGFTFWLFWLFTTRRQRGICTQLLSSQILPHQSTSSCRLGFRITAYLPIEGNINLNHCILIKLRFNNSQLVHLKLFQGRLIHLMLNVKCLTNLAKLGTHVPLTGQLREVRSNLALNTSMLSFSGEELTA